MSDNDIIILNEETIRDMVYEIRGQKVMLDFDLARIYGYETRAFNQQVKNNIERFPEEFRFGITSDELGSLVKSKKLISRNPSLFAGQSGGTRYLPFAFTEQGVYMVMTVLKGDLAVRQSILLIKLFKSMKDYLSKSRLAMDPAEVARRFEAGEARIGALESKLDVVMTQFENPNAIKEMLILDGERIEAGIAYQSIYAQASSSVTIIDDYVGLRTLHFLKACQKGVAVTILSDNVAKPPLGQTDLDDYEKDTGNGVAIKPTHGRIHDRYIILNHGLPNEVVYHFGASSKDAGWRITTITRLGDTAVLSEIVGTLLGEEG